MTTKPDAPKRLIIDNLQFERNRGDSVKILTSGGKLVAAINREDWDEVAKFFMAISNRDALL